MAWLWLLLSVGAILSALPNLFALAIVTAVSLFLLLSVELFFVSSIFVSVDAFSSDVFAGLFKLSAVIFSVAPLTTVVPLDVVVVFFSDTSSFDT